jgi:hypothetical protein
VQLASTLSVSGNAFFSSKVEGGYFRFKVAALSNADHLSQSITDGNVIVIPVAAGSRTLQFNATGIDEGDWFLVMHTGPSGDLTINNPSAAMITNLGVGDAALIVYAGGAFHLVTL